MQTKINVFFGINDFYILNERFLASKLLQNQIYNFLPFRSRPFSLLNAANDSSGGIGWEVGWHSSSAILCEQDIYGNIVRVIRRGSGVQEKKRKTSQSGISKVSHS